MIFVPLVRFAYRIYPMFMQNCVNFNSNTNIVIVAVERIAFGAVSLNKRGIDDNAHNVAHH